MVDPPDQRLRPEQERKFVKARMKAIAEAHQKGNHGKADRLATELVQYFGFGDDELPIEDMLEG